MVDEILKRTFVLLANYNTVASFEKCQVIGLPLRGESRTVLFLFLRCCIKADESEAFTTLALFILLQETEIARQISCINLLSSQACKASQAPRDHQIR